MSDTEKQVEEQVKNAVNANAAPAQSTELKNAAEDLGSAVVKPTDSNPDASKKINQVSGDAQQKNQGAADAMPKLKEEQKSDDKADEKEEPKKEAMHKDKMKKDELSLNLNFY